MMVPGLRLVAFQRARERDKRTCGFVFFRVSWLGAAEELKTISAACASDSVIVL